MTVTYKPTNVVISPFIRYSGTSAYNTRFSVSKQLKSFLGTANYLRDFVKDYSTLSQPLHQLLTDYNKTCRVVWTPKSTAAFHEMKLAISKCTTMHFMSDTAPITLHTAASDYGVGVILISNS